MKTLETKRLILRPWRAGDLNDFHEYCTDPEVGPNAGWKPHESLEESREILARFLKDEGECAVVLRENGKVIGSLGLFADKLGHEGLGAGREIGYVLSHAYWGQGLMPEAVQGVIRFVFEEEKFDYLSVAHFPFNARSKRVIEKCGFRFEKRLSGSYKDYKGDTPDEVCYLMTKEDYFSGV